MTKKDKIWVTAGITAVAVAFVYIYTRGTDASGGRRYPFTERAVDVIRTIYGR
jgi:hypothetical protein